MLSLSATLTYDGETLHDGPLVDTLDPGLGAHYGTTIGTAATIDTAATGAEHALTIDAPPQTARHEGYETAFIDVEDRNGTF